LSPVDSKGAVVIPARVGGDAGGDHRPAQIRPPCRRSQRWGRSARHQCRADVVSGAARG
jgi:hypothetical protein